MAKSTRGIITVELKGANALSATLREIPTEFRVWALKRATTKAARVMVGPLRRATPKADVYPKGTLSPKEAEKNPPGTLRKSTGLVFRKYRSGLIQSAYVGHRWHKKGFAAHLVGLGTQERFTTGKKSKKAGISSGRVPANDFMKQVVDAHKGQVNRVMHQELTAALPLAMEKARKKFGTFLDKRGF